MSSPIMDFCRFLHVDPDDNTLADCFAESFATLLESVFEQEVEDFPCSCGADFCASRREHTDECVASHRKTDVLVLSAQLGALHRLAKLGEQHPCSLALNRKRLAPAIAAIWADGPDSEAARAFRGEGSMPSRYDAALRGMDADIGHLQDENAKLRAEVESLRRQFLEKNGDYVQCAEYYDCAAAEVNRLLDAIRCARIDLASADVALRDALTREDGDSDG